MKDARIDLRIPHKTKTRWQKEADKRFGPNSLSRMIVFYVDRQLAEDVNTSSTNATVGVTTKTFNS